MFVKNQEHGKRTKYRTNQTTQKGKPHMGWFAVVGYWGIIISKTDRRLHSGVGLYLANVIDRHRHHYGNQT